MPRWHDRTSYQPLSYLRYPLSSSEAQRDTFFNDLRKCLVTGCQIHSQRDLHCWSLNGPEFSLDVSDMACLANNGVYRQTNEIVKVYRLTNFDEEYHPMNILETTVSTETVMWFNFL
ncbi:unnamed protein product [Umbelopsis vinacea]